MSYKFSWPIGLPARYSDQAGLYFRSYSTYSGGSESPDPASLVSGSLTTTSGSSTAISTYSIGASKTYVWRGYFKPDQSSTSWQFRLTSKDGSYLWVDTTAELPVASLATGSATVDNSGTHVSQTVTSGDISMNPSFHYAFVLIAGNDSGSGEITLEWRRDEGSWQSNGTSFLSYDSRYADGYGEDLYTASVSHTPLWAGVGRDGRVIYSSDATSWSEYESPAGETSDYWDISFGKDDSDGPRWIVATNTNPELRYSADPTDSSSWASIDFPGSSDLARTVEYGDNGTWIAATGDDVFRSTNGGDSWTKITDVAAGAGLNICLATDGNGNWAMGGATKVLKSTDDGLNWYVTLQSVGQTNGLEYNNGIWFRAGNGSSSHRIASLTDDDQVDSWSTVSGISTALWAICHIDGDTWMTANKGNDPYISTDNCASWTNAGLASPSGGQIMGLASDGTTVVSVGKDNKVNTSTDNGQSWTTRFTSAVDLLVVEYNKVKPF